MQVPFDFAVAFQVAVHVIGAVRAEGCAHREFTRFGP